MLSCFPFYFVGSVFSSWVLPWFICPAVFPSCDYLMLSTCVWLSTQFFNYLPPQFVYKSIFSICPLSNHCARDCAPFPHVPKFYSKYSEFCFTLKSIPQPIHCLNCLHFRLKHCPRVLSNTSYWPICSPHE